MTRPMPLIMVGGQTKDVGKTTLVCNIIAAFPQFRWTAVKFTRHFHLPENSRLLVKGKDYSFWEQTSAGNTSDTARYVSAGAECALLIQVADGKMKEACTAVHKELSPRTHILVESSGAAEFLSPDLYLMVLDSAKSDFKYSAREMLGDVDGFILREAGGEVPRELQAHQKPSYRSMPDRLDPALAVVVARVLGNVRYG